MAEAVVAVTARSRVCVGGLRETLKSAAGSIVSEAEPEDDLNTMSGETDVEPPEYEAVRGTEMGAVGSVGRSFVSETAQEAVAELAEGVKTTAEHKVAAELAKVTVPTSGMAVAGATGTTVA